MQENKRVPFISVHSVCVVNECHGQLFRFFSFRGFMRLGRTRKRLSSGSLSISFGELAYLLRLLIRDKLLEWIQRVETSAKTDDYHAGVG